MPSSPAAGPRRKKRLAGSRLCSPTGIHGQAAITATLQDSQIHGAIERRSHEVIPPPLIKPWQCGSHRPHQAIHKPELLIPVHERDLREFFESSLLVSDNAEYSRLYRGSRLSDDHQQQIPMSLLFGTGWNAERFLRALNGHRLMMPKVILPSGSDVPQNTRRPPNGNPRATARQASVVGSTPGTATGVSAEGYDPDWEARDCGLSGAR